LINLDTPGGNQLKPPSIYHLSLDLHQFAYHGVLRLSTYDTNTHTSSHVLHNQDRRSNTIWVVQKAFYGAYITSRLGIKKFPWVTSIGASGAGATFVPITRTLQISFSQTLGIFSIGRTQDIIPQGSKHSIRSNLQDWEKGAWMTHYHVSGFAAFVLSAILCLETYTGPIWNCNCHLPLVSSWDISEPPSLGGSVRRA
jgi:hypothetical protein